MEHKIELEEKRREVAEHRLKEALQEIKLLKGKLQAYQPPEEEEKVEVEGEGEKTDYNSLSPNGVKSPE